MLKATENKTWLNEQLDLCFIHSSQWWCDNEISCFCILIIQAKINRFWLDTTVKRKLMFFLIFTPRTFFHCFYRERKGEMDTLMWERSIDRLPPIDSRPTGHCMCPAWGVIPQRSNLQLRNWTRKLSVLGWRSSQLSHTGQGNMGFLKIRFPSVILKWITKTVRLCDLILHIPL